MTDDLDPARLGVFTRGEAIADGWSDRALRRATGAGDLVRVRHGAYVPAHLWPATELERHRLRSRAVLLAADTEAALSHTSACVEYGVDLWDVPLAEVHLTRLDRRSGRREAGVIQHHGVVHDAEVLHHAGVPLLSPTRTLMDMCSICGFERSVVVADCMLHMGLTSKDDLWAAFDRHDRWPNTLATRLVLGFADGLSESVGESRARMMFKRGGIPDPVLQYEIFDPPGVLIARLDFLWPEYGVYGEFDGKGKYLNPPQGRSIEDMILSEKRRDQAVFELTGWRGIRFGWWDLEHPGPTLARVRRMLAAGQRGRAAYLPMHG